MATFIPRMITVHCSATPNGARYSLEQIRLDHVARGFKDVGYHYIIQPQGLAPLDIGRSIIEEGAHVFGHNEGNVGICLIGTDKFTPAQVSDLRSLLESLKRDYWIPTSQLWVHSDFDTAKEQGKTCPNFTRQQLHDWWNMEAEFPCILVRS